MIKAEFTNCPNDNVSEVRRRVIPCGTLLANTAGQFALIENGALDGAISRPASIEVHGQAAKLARLAQTYLETRRRACTDILDYLILVPTLRCNLACSYCQVSRASIKATGYDWSDQTLAEVLKLVASLDAPAVKIEFQGGEPTLRPDLIRAVIEAVPDHVDGTFVICTNLQHINPETLAIFDRDDVTISTSLDGPLELHARQRHGDDQMAKRFSENFDAMLKRYGSQKISALPTIDPLAPPNPDSLVDAFVARGLHSIYLRPINYQGFARKRHAHSREVSEAWHQYHRSFVERLIARNWQDQSKCLEETYFSLLLRRIFRPGSDRHVDLRNPNPIGRDYIVIDYDGTAYPTDEARMLSRSGVIDLSIGDVASGWDTPERSALDAVSTLDGNPTCEACVYKPYCGRDIVDDLSRYGTIDVPRAETEFCRRHLALFDFAFELIHSDSEQVHYSLGLWLGLPGPMPLMGSAA